VRKDGSISGPAPVVLESEIKPARKKTAPAAKEVAADN
jgi:hypothetical protein